MNNRDLLETVFPEGTQEVQPSTGLPGHTLLSPVHIHHCVVNQVCREDHHSWFSLHPGLLQV